MSTNERTPSGQLHKDIIIPIVKTNIGKRPKLIYQKKENIIIYKISSAIKTKNKNKQVRKHGEHLHPRVTPTTLYSANSICGPLSPQTDSSLWGCRDCASPSLCVWPSTWHSASNHSRHLWYPPYDREHVGQGSWTVRAYNEQECMCLTS